MVFNDIKILTQYSKQNGRKDLKMESGYFFYRWRHSVIILSFLMVNLLCFFTVTGTGCSCNESEVSGDADVDAEAEIPDMHTDGDMDADAEDHLDLDMATDDEADIDAIDVEDDDSMMPCSECASLMGSYEEAMIMDVVVVGNLAYASDRYEGLIILDISNPESIARLGTLTPPSELMSAAVVDGEKAYVGFDNCLMVADISNPNSPLEESRVNMEGDGHTRAVILHNDHVWIGRDTPEMGGYLEAYDISGDTPQQVYSSTDFVVSSMDITGEYLLIADSDMLDSAAFVILNISDPVDPAEVSRVELGENLAFGIAVTGFDIAVLSTNFDVRVYDISDPSSPALRSFINAPIDIGWDVARWGENGAALATYGTGLLLLDLSDPDEPVCLHLGDTAGDAFGLITQNHMVYVGEGVAGMEIFSSEGCL